MDAERLHQPWFAHLERELGPGIERAGVRRDLGSGLRVGVIPVTRALARARFDAHLEPRSHEPCNRFRDLRDAILAGQGLSRHRDREHEREIQAEPSAARNRRAPVRSAERSRRSRRRRRAPKRGAQPLRMMSRDRIRSWRFPNGSR